MTHSARDRLLQRWSALVGPSDGSVRIGGDLWERWNEPHRRFHTVTHLAAVLDHLDELGSRTVATRLAAWFHDAVYRTERSDNEEVSARLAESTLPGLGIESVVVVETARLIRLTASHDPSPDDYEGQILCDADLSILGSDPAVYSRYRAAVREEYSGLSEQSWRAGRAEVLRGLLARTRLFCTEQGHHRWEASARSNICSELDSLERL